MRLNRSLKLVAPLAVALLAGCFTANRANAQEIYRGSFTLPVEARWGNVVLPPGDYSFTLDHGTVAGIVTLREESGRTVGFIPNQATYGGQTFDRSELVLALSGGNYMVRAVRMAELGVTIEYSAPKTGKQQIVQGPQLLERIPVAMGG